MTTILGWFRALLIAILLFGNTVYAEPEESDKLDVAYYKTLGVLKRQGVTTHWVGYRKKQVLHTIPEDPLWYTSDETKKWTIKMMEDGRLTEKPSTMTGLLVGNTIYFHSMIKFAVTPPGGLEVEMNENTLISLENSKPTGPRGKTSEHGYFGTCGEVMAVDFWFRDTGKGIEELQATRKFEATMYGFDSDGHKSTFHINPCNGDGRKIYI